MNSYDVVVVGDRSGQVKLWARNFEHLFEGSAVQPVRGARSYDVVMREGGYLHVRDLAITGWDDEPGASMPVFDKWGAEWVNAEKNIGEVGKALAELVGGSSGYFHDATKGGEDG